MSADHVGSPPTPPAGRVDAEVMLPAGFDDLDHERKLAALTRNAVADIRTEIDRVLGIPRQEFSGSQPFQFNKEQLALILVALGGPQR
jgi:hypothetical protein